MTPTEKNNLDFTAIGQRIRDARTRKGLRITDAIELTGMSSGVISALEIGNRNPGLNSLVTFSKAYDVSLDELVFGRSPSASTLSTSPVSQRAKTDKTERHQNKSFTHKEKPDRMITRSGRGTGQTNNARSLANAIGA